MGTRKTTSFFGKRITDEIEDKKLQPIVLGAANLAAELQDQNLTLILYMAATTHSIHVNAPLRAVYNQWTQFEEFPLFMEGVEQVRQEGGKEPFQEEHVEFPLSRKEVVVEKKTHLTGGVRVRKTEGTEQRTVQENVRREEVDVDESGRTSSKGPAGE